MFKKNLCFVVKQQKSKKVKKYKLYFKLLKYNIGTLIDQEEFIKMKVINKLWNKFLGYLEDKKIYRTYDGALFAGVCSGISKRFGISLSLVRVLFLLTGIAFIGSPLILYFLLVIVMPAEPRKQRYRKPSYIDVRAWEK